MSYDCWAFSLDLAGAYLYANPSRIVYLRAPGHLQDILDPSEIPMTPSGKPARYFRAARAVYGCRSACKDFYVHYATWLREHGFTQSTVDACVWFRFRGPKDFVILLTHSDDNLCVGLGDASKKELMEAWSADFDQSPDSAGVDNLHEFLGLRVDCKDDHMLISAPAIIAKLPAMVGSCPSSCSSPLSVTHGCDDPVDPVKNPPYEGKIDLRQPLGVCLFVALSCRPDVAHAAIWLSSYVGRKILTKNVARQVNRLAWYLVTTLETHVLCFRKSDGVLRALMDASLANDASLKSWYGFSTTLGVNTGVIAFRSALARSIVASTRDSELLACLHCTYRVFALRLFLAEIGLQQVAPTPMGSDAMAVIQGVSVKTVHRDSRWSAIRFAVIKQAMEDLLISCYHLPGTDNGSDIYTKILPPALHFKHAMHQLGWPASAARDIAMLEQIHHDSVLMVHHNSAEEATAIGFVDESELAPSVAALFK